MKPARVLLISLLVAGFSAVTARADDALKSIDDPHGGRIVYGQVAGQTTQDGAMGAVLRSIRDKWGEEPQVGKFFRVRGTNSIATFITGVNHLKGEAQWAGLVIVSQVAPDSVEAALLSDDAQRFGKNINPMLGELTQAWHPDSTGSGAAPRSTAAQSTAAQGADGAIASAAASSALHNVTLGDGSASVSLPDGWQVLPESGGGTIYAGGPNGEKAALGFTLRALNINDPRVRRTMQFAQGAGRNTAYAQALYYPYGADMAKTFVDLNQAYREKRGLPTTAFQIESSTDVPSAPGWRRAYLTGHLDAHDGVGLREMNTVFSCAPPGPTGGFMTYTNHTAVPVQFAQQERATMLAIIASYSVNNQVVANQAAAYAAPEIARIHEIGKRAAAQAASAHAAEDIHNAAVERHWDSIDRQSKSFSDYLLDQSVITDNQGNHATVWNQTADAMVHSNPQRYEYVATPNLRKGVDF